jgi:AcrR family transcriptional regulator
MDVKNNPALDVQESETRRTLKRVARELFAERGIRSVSVREIAQAADQKNQGAIAYYFGTKDKLIAELLIDGARRIEARRQVYIDTLEADGGPHTVEDAVAAIVMPSARFSDEDPIYGTFFNRFLIQLSQSSPDFADTVLKDRWSAGYQRCLKHLRRLMPDKPLAVQNRRFVFLGMYVSSLLAQREAMMADTSRAHAMWRSDEMLEDIIRTTTALLQAPSDGKRR